MIELEDPALKATLERRQENYFDTDEGRHSRELIGARLNEADALIAAGFSGPALIAVYAAVETVVWTILSARFVAIGLLSLAQARAYSTALLQRTGLDHGKIVVLTQRFLGIDAGRDPTSIAFAWRYSTSALPKLRREYLAGGRTITPEESRQAHAAARLLADCPPARPQKTQGRSR